MSSSPPPRKKAKQTDNESATSTKNRSSTEILLDLDPIQVVQHANGNLSVQKQLLEFAQTIQRQVMMAIEKGQKQQEPVINGSKNGTNKEATESNSTPGQQNNDDSKEKTCTECSRPFLKALLTPCTCFFEEDDFVSGVLICKDCLATGNDDRFKTCSVCKQLHCRINKDGCNPKSCGDCANIMCEIHTIAENCKDCFKRCMCGKKIWCITCSAAIDAQVKSLITTECDDCKHVACGLDDCTIYKTCRLCYKRLCDQCVYRTKCDCDPTIPLCAACEETYVCPNPDCPGPSMDAANIILSELS